MDRETVAVQQPLEKLAALLVDCGEKLPPAVRSEILALGKVAVPELVQIVADDEFAVEGSEGWAPIHAVDLLVELQAQEAVPTLLAALVRTHYDDILHNRIAVRLPELGAQVFEPAAALMETLEDVDTRESLCSVLAQLGVRDERIFDWCKESFDRGPVIGAMQFGDYGDERALPLISKAIEEFEPNWDSPFGMMDLRNLIDSYEEIAGDLPDHLAYYAAELYEVWEEHRTASDAPEEPFVAPPKVGRNDPCPCASGKKYKRCCGA